MYTSGRFSQAVCGGIGLWERMNGALLIQAVFFQAPQLPPICSTSKGVL